LTGWRAVTVISTDNRFGDLMSHRVQIPVGSPYPGHLKEEKENYEKENYEKENYEKGILQSNH
jgi:hypothetical protein